MSWERIDLYGTLEKQILSISHGTAFNFEWALNLFNVLRITNNNSFVVFFSFSADAKSFADGFFEKRQFYSYKIFIKCETSNLFRGKRKLNFPFQGNRIINRWESFPTFVICHRSGHFKYMENIVFFSWKIKYFKDQTWMKISTDPTNNGIFPGD